MNYLDKLNEAQLEAVTTTEGPVLVLAGAGTGKTRVLTNRIAHIIEQSLASPENILAVTFTNKASKEMQERISSITSNIVGLNIGTFHAISARMLRQYAHIFNLSSSFTIISPDDQLKLVKELLTIENIDIKKITPKIILGIISRWKDLGLLHNKVSNSDIISSNDRIAFKIYSEYQARLLQSNAVDFGDLLLYNNELLINNPEILKLYQQRFKYIMIDEYQDTNAVQYVWARMLASSHNNICCVGDDDQSIYSWRGAEVGNILRFEKDFKNAKIIKLEQNYRSTMPILIAAGSVIKNNRQRHSKSLWTADPEGEKVRIISCINDKEEARFVTSKINELIRYKNLNQNQIAILVRTGAQTRPFEESLISNAIPYRIIGGLKFYDRMEIRDIIAYIRSSLNHSDDLALERIINVPKRGIGDIAIREIKSYAQSNHLSIFDAIKNMLKEGLLKNKLASSLSNLIDMFESWNSFAESGSPDILAKRILEESGYLNALKEEKTEESKARIENINEMLRAISEFSEMKSFIEHTSLVMDHDGESNSAGAISLMTLHASKGLEFDAVFLPGWEEGLFPHQRSIQEEGAKGLEEERRIAYVGITRAKKFLYISYADSRFLFHEVIKSAPSRFLSEIPDEISEKGSSFLSYSYKPNNNYVKNNTHSIQPNDKIIDKWRAGAKVKHSSFGNGIILRKNFDNFEIAFDKAGLKTIKQNFLELV